MSKIFCIIGKSSTGKDSIYKQLCSDEKLGLKTIVPYTTRPIRIKETDGVEYHFCSAAELNAMEDRGVVIERRDYDTACGVWTYFTADDGQVTEDADYIVIGTLESYISLRNYYGAERLVPIYIYVEDGARLARALKRERKQTEPKYKEMCRRFLADEEDFSEERLDAAGIDVRFENVDEHIEDTIAQIADYIKDQLKT